MRDYVRLKDVAELVKTRYTKCLTGLVVNQFQTEVVEITFYELYSWRQKTSHSLCVQSVYF